MCVCVDEVGVGGIKFQRLKKPPKYLYFYTEFMPPPPKKKKKKKKKNLIRFTIFSEVLRTTLCGRTGSPNQLGLVFTFNCGRPLPTGWVGVSIM